MSETIGFDCESFFIYFLCKIKPTPNQRGCLCFIFKCVWDHQAVISSPVSGQTVTDNIFTLKKRPVLCSRSSKRNM